MYLQNPKFWQWCFLTLAGEVVVVGEVSLAKLTTNEQSTNMMRCEKTLSIGLAPRATDGHCI
jgi:hypothetical protein